MWDLVGPCVHRTIVRRSVRFVLLTCSHALAVVLALDRLHLHRPMVPRGGPGAASRGVLCLLRKHYLGEPQREGSGGAAVSTLH